MTAQITISTAKVSGLLFRSMTAHERLGDLFSFHLQFESQDPTST